MNRHRLSATAVLVTALALTTGCGKKTEPTSEVTVAPEPKPNPGPTAEDAEKAAKAEVRNRLKQIGLAMHNFEGGNQFFPAGIVGPKGELGLSWRVQLLLFLESKEDAALYHQFKLNEPWDSEHNKKLLAKMPKVYASPGKAAPEGKTYLRSFAGPAAFIQMPHRGFVPKGKEPPPFLNMQPGFPAPGQRMSGITDGTSNTLMVAEAAEPVEWTKPDDLPFPGLGFEPNPAPLPILGGVFPGGFHGLMCDGAQHFFPTTLDEKTVRAMISTNGGEVLPQEVSEILFPPKPKTPAAPTTVPADLPDAAARKTATANYLVIVKGMHAHHDVYGYLPTGLLANKAVGLSWRVQILPFIGEDKLFKEFKLTEPWDSDHNKALLAKMPKVFESPGKPAEKGHTFVRTTMGPGGIIPTAPDGKPQLRPDSRPGTPLPGRPLISGIPDGLSNTILFVEAGEAVPWTKPDELSLPSPFDPKGGPVLDAKLPPLGGVFPDGFHAAMADARVTFYKTGYPTGSLAKLFCPNDGWIVEPLAPVDKILYSIPFTPPVAPRPQGKGDLIKGDGPVRPPK
jgi:hypothetical protein